MRVGSSGSGRPGGAPASVRHQPPAKHGGLYSEVSAPLVALKDHSVLSTVQGFVQFYGIRRKPGDRRKRSSLGSHLRAHPGTRQT